MASWLAANRPLASDLVGGEMVWWQRDWIQFQLLALPAEVLNWYWSTVLLLERMLLLRLLFELPPITDADAFTLVADTDVWFTLLDSWGVEGVGTGGFSGVGIAVRLVDCALQTTCTGAPSATISYETYNSWTKKPVDRLLESDRKERKFNCWDTKPKTLFPQVFISPFWASFSTFTLMVNQWYVSKLPPQGGTLIKWSPRK